MKKEISLAFLVSEDLIVKVDAAGHGRRLLVGWEDDGSLVHVLGSPGVGGGEPVLLVA